MVRFVRAALEAERCRRQLNPKEGPGWICTVTRRSAALPPGKRRNTVGYEYVYIAVDDYSRLAYAEVLPDEKQRPRSACSAAPSPSTGAWESRWSRY